MARCLVEIWPALNPVGVSGPLAMFVAVAASRFRRIWTWAPGYGVYRGTVPRRRVVLGTIFAARRGFVRARLAVRGGAETLGGYHHRNSAEKDHRAQQDFLEVRGHGILERFPKRGPGVTWVNKNWPELMVVMNPSGMQTLSRHPL